MSGLYQGVPSTYVMNDEYTIHSRSDVDLRRQSKLKGKGKRTSEHLETFEFGANPGIANGAVRDAWFKYDRPSSLALY